MPEMQEIMCRDPGDPITFVCTDCGTRIHVDEAMRETLLATGCIECDADVSRTAFEREP